MGVFGGYETVRELGRSGLAASLTARRSGAAAEKFVVKSFCPPPGEFEEEQVRPRIEAFLDGARAHQQVVRSGARHWATVHEVGEADGGAYFVTDYHGRSVRHLIRGQVKLGGRGLHQIVTGIVEGLIELKLACKRPHGNLKPTNILLTGKAGMDKAIVLLTDPAPGRQIDPKQGDVVDLHALGELIYQLVLLRTGRAMSGWPAPEGPEWTRLGRCGEQWRQLCNRLLNPNLAPGLLALEDLAEDVRKLKVGRKLPLAVLVGVAAVLAAGAAGGDYALRKDQSLVGSLLRPKKAVVVDRGDWDRLCSDYRGWFSTLRADLEKQGLDKLASDPYLKEKLVPVLEPVLAGKVDVSPHGMAPPGTDLRFWSPSAEAVDRSTKALATMEAIRKAVNDGNWPALAAVKQRAEEYARCGWAAPAAYLQSVVKSPDEQAAQRIGRVLAVRRQLQDVEARWAEVKKVAGEVGRWGRDPNLTSERLEQYCLGETASSAEKAGPECIGKLVEDVKQLLAEDSLLQRLAAMVKNPPVVDEGDLQRDPPFRLGGDGKLTGEAIRRGLAKLMGDSYKPRPDPRTAQWQAASRDALTAAASDTSNVLAEVEQLLKDPKLDAEDRQKVAGAATEAKAVIEQVEQAKAVLAKAIEPKAYTSGTRDDVDAAMRTLEAQLKALGTGIGRPRRQLDDARKSRATKLSRSWADFVAVLRGRQKIAAGSLEIDAVWLVQRDQLIAGAEAEKDVAGLAAKVDRVEAFLRALEAPLAGELPGKVEPRAWSRALVSTAELQARRSAAIQTVLGCVKWDAVHAGRDDKDVTACREQTIESYNSWRTGVVAVVGAFSQIEDLLKQGYLPEEKPAAGQTLGELFAAQQKTAMFRDPGVAKAIAPLVTRVNELKAVEAAGEAAGLAKLAAAARQDQFEIARAAWRRLGGTSKPWPGSRAEFGQELEIQKSLAAVYDLLGDAGRRSALKAELAAGGPSRWETYFLTRTDVADIEDAVARMGQFGLDRAKGAAVSPAAQYRLLVYDFRKEVNPQSVIMDDPAVKNSIGRFAKSVAALPPAAAKKADVAALLGKLEEIRTAQGGGVDLSKAGPALAAWTKTEETEATVTYSWEGRGRKLRFRRVEVPGGKGCFLSTTEVPVGLFVSVVMGEKKWAEMAKLLPSSATTMDDSRQGPRTWALERGQIVLAERWLFDTPALGGVHYPPGREPEKPDAEHPMCHVTASAATYLAKLLGCRLPTSAEWQAAEASNAKAKASTLPNLRDRAWATQRDFVFKDIEGQTKAGEEFYADAGIFWPKGVDGAARKAGHAATVVDQNDGVVWFSKVGSDTERPFAHLVGNVAEFAYEDTDSLRDLKATGAADVLGFVRKQAGNFRVIGGSALSAPEVPVDKPLEMAKVDSESDAFCDVGFRLAFWAGQERLQGRLWRAVEGAAAQGYLGGE
jgi:formylglycine-generating enzyme required for sulfatase activity